MAGVPSPPPLRWGNSCTVEPSLKLHSAIDWPFCNIWPAYIKPISVPSWRLTASTVWLGSTSSTKVSPASVRAKSCMSGKYEDTTKRGKKI
eukprot:CAMPEP_0117491190 /NCGR_PEP_ID=MMETSP0784-20121206/17937_1 /TAXON_ID=39447 /ORGANISM="" /LENGTH=90 /DNA_ID=CAMNT_0005285969 /DNA_START=352 /DNA_END=624 /DNA_ORIENTATION=+